MRSEYFCSCLTNYGCAPFLRSFCRLSACSGFEERLFLLSQRNIGSWKQKNIDYRINRSNVCLLFEFVLGLVLMHTSKCGTLRNQPDSCTLSGVALIDKVVPRYQCCWSRENQCKSGLILWNSMMELADMPWRSTICRICRLWTSNLKMVRVTLNRTICDLTVLVLFIWGQLINYAWVVLM